MGGCILLRWANPTELFEIHLVVLVEIYAFRFQQLALVILPKGSWMLILPLRLITRCQGTSGCSPLCSAAMA